MSCESSGKMSPFSDLFPLENVRKSSNVDGAIANFRGSVGGNGDK